MAVFTPNLTSKLLFKAGLVELANTTGSVLEIGCGSGWITQELVRSTGIARHEYYLSDISTEAIEVARKNLDGLVNQVDIRVGNAFDPWLGMKFDVIINDVAGISDKIAEASDWYIDVPFNAGIDGLDNTRMVLSQIQTFLKPGGVFIAPVISLSDVSEYHRLLAEAFRSITLQHQTWWPMPDDLINQSKIIDDLLDLGVITLKEKYSKVLAFTEVAVCRSLVNERGSIDGR